MVAVLYYVDNEVKWMSWFLDNCTCIATIGNIGNFSNGNSSQTFYQRLKLFDVISWQKKRNLTGVEDLLWLMILISTMSTVPSSQTNHSNVSSWRIQWEDSASVLCSTPGLRESLWWSSSSTASLSVSTNPVLTHRTATESVCFWR